jgi:hypothetical protein
MFRNHLIAFSAAALGALAFAAAPVSAQTKYKVLDLSTPGSPFSDIDGVWKGQSVGYEYFGTGKCRGGFVCEVDHAKYWPTLKPAPIDLHPPGWTWSYAEGISGARQAGYVKNLVNNLYQDHAAVWSGTAASFVDIHPAAFYGSEAADISGNEVVGDAYNLATASHPHALLWELNLGTFVDLNPRNAAYSYAMATAGGQQVGYAANGKGQHAFLWEGTAASAVDLNPAGVGMSLARGTDKQQQVGYGDNDAYVWSGTAASAVDLNPPGGRWSFTVATAVRGGRQVGYGELPGFNDHALTWAGTASSVIDLHKFLPAGFTQSTAKAIDGRGNIGGYAVDGAGVAHAILWQPIP